MKTTLNIDDALLREAKKAAADRGVTLTTLVQDAIRSALTRRPMRGYRLNVPVVRGRGSRVDVRDRDALYEVMEGRE
jgi:phosphatidylserine/phosphatidylglycerophosphate/cardiolipin synthase-like enzyme